MCALHNIYPHLSTAATCALQLRLSHAAVLPHAVPRACRRAVGLLICAGIGIVTVYGPHDSPTVTPKMMGCRATRPGFLAFEAAIMCLFGACFMATRVMCVPAHPINDQRASSIGASVEENRPAHAVCVCVRVSHSTRTFTTIRDFWLSHTHKSAAVCNGRLPQTAGGDWPAMTYLLGLQGLT